MRRSLLSALALFAVLAHAPAGAVEPGESAPDLALGLPRAGTLAALRGQVVWLDFWASYCGPCRKSFPWLNELQARYGGKGLAIVAVNVDEKRADAERFLAQTPAQFPIAYDPQQTSPARYAIRGMPTSVLIGADGKVIRVHRGFHDDQRAELEAAIAQALTAVR